MNRVDLQKPAAGLSREEIEALPSLPAIRVAGRAFIARKCGGKVARLSLPEQEPVSFPAGLPWAKELLRCDAMGTPRLDHAAFRRAWEKEINRSVRWHWRHTDRDPVTVRREAVHQACECLRKQVAFDVAAGAVEAHWRTLREVWEVIRELPAKRSRSRDLDADLLSAWWAWRRRGLAAGPRVLGMAQQRFLQGDEYRRVMAFAAVTEGGHGEIERICLQTMDLIRVPSVWKAVCGLGRELDQHGEVSGEGTNRFLPPVPRGSWPARCQTGQRGCSEPV